MVAASALLFATKAIVVKCAYPYGIGALDLLTLRMGFALPVFLLVAWHEERRAAARLSVGDLGRCCGLGIIGYYLASFLDFEGLRVIGVGLERMVLYLYPTIVVVVGALIFGHKVTGRVIVALVATYGGIVLTYVGQRHDGTQIAWGTALVAGSAATYALFVLFSGTLIARLGARRVMAVAMSGACMAMLLHAGIHASCGGDTYLFAQPMVVYGYGLVLAVFGTILPSLLMGDGLKRVGSQRFAIISTIGPIGTLLLGWMVLGETVTPIASVGIALTLLASIIMGLSK